MGVKRIEIEGKGDKVPIGDNSTEAGRKENRRVEIKITGVSGLFK